MNKHTQAEDAINTCGVLTKLDAFTPQVVSTINVGLDTDQSDIDILCCFVDAHGFKDLFHQYFQSYPDFHYEAHAAYSLGQFAHGGFLFEIYGSVTPVKQQAAWRHFQIMQRLVKIGGSDFQHQVRALKEQGLKTEPAICKILQIEGDPYSAILQTEAWPDGKLKKHIFSK